MNGTSNRRAKAYVLTVTQKWFFWVKQVPHTEGHLCVLLKKSITPPPQCPIIQDVQVCPDSLGTRLAHRLYSCFRKTLRQSQETIKAAHDDVFKVKAATPRKGLSILTFALGTMKDNCSVLMCTLDAISPLDSQTREMTQ